MLAAASASHRHLRKPPWQLTPRHIGRTLWGGTATQDAGYLVSRMALAP